MNRRARARATTRLAALVAVACLAASCGSSSKSSQSGTTTSAAAPTGSTTTVAPTSSSTPAPTPTSMDQWEALWAQERAAIVKRIKDNKWGKSADGKTLAGPEGFTIDLSKCGGGWSDTEGLTDAEIKIGHTISMSGTTADYGNATKTLALIFDYYSQKGVFKDVNGKTRKINYMPKDDGYDPARTIPLTDEMIDSEKVFEELALGSPNVLKIYDKLNQRCIPNPFMASGHPAFGDPVNHPWTTGAPQTSYSTEAVLWGSFIEQRLSEFPSGKVKVASLIMNNDFGRIYDQSFKAYLAQSPSKDKIEYASETIEPQAPSMIDPMTTLAAKNPDFFIAMVAASLCTQAVVTAAQNGMHDKAKYLLQPATCTGTGYVAKEKVGGDGAAANGWWLVNPGFKDFNDPSQFSDAYVAWGRDLMTSHGLDPKASSSYANGFPYAFGVTQALQIAGQLDGGLTRSNYILAIRSLDMTNPYYLPGIRFHLNGNKDAFLEEGGMYQQWDSLKQIWVTKGKVIDLDGKSKNCAWDSSAGTCR
jgi:ABC-type branched-subunit amino acid transport system substrate-binding protein